VGLLERKSREVGAKLFIRSRVICQLGIQSINCWGSSKVRAIRKVLNNSYRPQHQGNNGEKIRKRNGWGTKKERGPGGEAT